MNVTPPQVGTGNISYQALYGMVSKALYRTHVEGKLKAEIIQVRVPWRACLCMSGRGRRIRGTRDEGNKEEERCGAVSRNTVVLCGL